MGLSNLSANSFVSHQASTSTGSQVDTIAAEGVGTPGWIAPEELGSGMVSPRLDVYSFAMILWELLHAEKPFEEELFAPGINASMQKLRMVELLKEEKRPPIKASAAWFQCVDATWDSYCTLMTHCWKSQPSSRPDFSEVQRRLEEIKKLLITAKQTIGVGKRR